MSTHPGRYFDTLELPFPIQCGVGLPLYAFLFIQIFMNRGTKYNKVSQYIYNLDIYIR